MNRNTIFCDWWARPTVRQVASCFLVGVLVGLLYLDTLGHEFTNWDDGMIYQNPRIRNLSWENTKKIFTYIRGQTYQPVRELSYAIDYHFWGLNPTGYRITNIFFYILTCIVVFFTFQLLSARLRESAEPGSHFRVALVGTLLFAAHPVHVEAVTWLAARKEVLQGFFFFLALYLSIRGIEDGRNRIVYLGLGLVSILLAILSKPAAVVFPGVILLYEITRKREEAVSLLRTHWVFFLFLVVLSALFGFILIKVMLVSGGIKPFRGGSFWNNLLVSLYSFVYSIKLLIATINFSAAYSFTIRMPTLSYQNLAFLALTLSLTVASILSLRWTKVIFFSFFFFVLCLFPYLNLLPISTFLADRYVFIASFSYVFLLGVLFDWLYGHRFKRFSPGFSKLFSAGLFLLLLTSYSYMTVQQNKVWENSYTLWADAVEKSPESNVANALMGVVYMDLRMNKEALGYLEKAVQIMPEDYQSRNNLGIVYGRMGNHEKALQELLTALSIRPDLPAIKINLAVYYERTKEYEKAEAILRALLADGLWKGELHYRLGLLYNAMGRYEAAITELTRAIELEPRVIDSYVLLGNIYLNAFQDVEKAKYYFTKGIEAAPKGMAKSEELRWVIQDLEGGR